MASDQQIEDVYIAVVGVAGAGKDSLISSFLGDNHLPQDDAPHSVDDASTTNQDISFLYNDTQRVHLIDIPGFTSDDTDPEQQQNTLNRINTLVADGKTFSGIVFLHPISDSQTATLALQNMELLRSLCADSSQTTQTLTVLATSMWSRVDPELGAERERTLVEEDEFAQQLLTQEGGKVFRYEDTRESAMEILSYLLSRQITAAGAAKIDSGVDKACQTGEELTGEWEREISAEREKHMARLAEMYALMEEATREHDSNVRGIVKVEVESLKKRIREGEEQRERLEKALEEVKRVKGAEVEALRGEISEERKRHKEETEQFVKEAKAERARREEEQVRQREERVAAVRAEMTQESESRVKSLLEEMTHEADERVKAVRAEMTHEADERVKAVRAEMTHEADARVQALRREMEKMKLEFEREREQNMKTVRAEMSRLVEREKEARERAQRAEVVRKTEEYRQPLQAWAVARLWGVGQTRSR
ncbi:hypothetical protein B0T16DRAFT_463503 [Cercophora newfieldiana]|uniref:G domain-containing protein n=1 Tax=Cercophora newfieldiana TaxID=92897 RepID=A0AA39XTC4_9PEZI|nr:hypothetical protein B0T16DRAFT_463503 [Cercophora newfieldiana]